MTAPMISAQAIRCDMSLYKGSEGLMASVEQDLLVVTWMGQREAELRIRFAIRKGQPMIHDLAIREKNGRWVILGKNLIPEYNVVSGIRRGEGSAILESSVDIKFPQEVINNQRWLSSVESGMIPACL